MNITKEVKLVSTSRQAATPMASHRKISLTAGLLYLLTMVSIPTLALYGQVKGANYILGAGPDTAAMLGGLSEVIVALAGIGTANTYRYNTQSASINSMTICTDHHTTGESIIF